MHISSLLSTLLQNSPSIVSPLEKVRNHVCIQHNKISFFKFSGSLSCFFYPYTCSNPGAGNELSEAAPAYAKNSSLFSDLGRSYFKTEFGGLFYTIDVISSNYTNEEIGMYNQPEFSNISSIMYASRDVGSHHVNADSLCFPYSAIIENTLAGLTFYHVLNFVRMIPNFSINFYFNKTQDISICWRCLIFFLTLHLRPRYALQTYKNKLLGLSHSTKHDTISREVFTQQPVYTNWNQAFLWESYSGLEYSQGVYCSSSGKRLSGQ